MNETPQTNPRILIADDETKNIQLLGTLLKQKGYHIHVAQNGREALDTVQEVLPDLILLDIMMPEMDGFEVCKKLKSSPNTQNIPVIFLTVKSDAEDIVRGFELGAADYVTKPFNSTELMARVQTHLNVQMLQEQLKRRNCELVVTNGQLIQEVAEHRQAERALRESEKHFRWLVEYGADPILVQNLAGHILIANKPACKSLGYSREELLSMNMADVETHVGERLHEEGDGEETPVEQPLLMETRYTRKDGSSFPVEVRLVEAQLERQKVIVAFARNIEIRKQMEKKHLRIKKLESLATLVSGIAHDFNNLLFIISGNASLVKQDIKPGEKVLKHFKEIEKATQLASDLTRELITFSKGGTPLKKLASPGELILNLLSSTDSSPGITYDIQIPESLWEAEIDEGQIRQVLKNLVTNANDAMPQGGVIQVSARNLTLNKKEWRSGVLIEAGEYVEIRVQDQGSGIPEEHLSVIFDPYFSTKERDYRKGMGLGLAIVYSIVRKHEGYIFVKSEAPVGTAFEILLPAIAKKAHEPPGLVGTYVKDDETVRKILVMDDEEMTRNMLERMLTRMGYQVETAIHGTDAIEQYKRAMDSENPFDVVILDLIIAGGMDGRETMKILLNLDPRVKAVISSAYYDDPIIVDFEGYGFCDALPKPYSIKRLKGMLERILNQPVRKTLCKRRENHV